MGYGDYHSHTADDVGAARSDHRHSAYELGAAEDNHRHSPRDVGASPEGHEHALSQISGAASEQELHELERQVQQLAADLEAERRANAALRAGAVTLPTLVSALREQASALMQLSSRRGEPVSRQIEDPVSESPSLFLAQAMTALADTIQREAR
jgi:hypothetical protein